MLANNHAAQFAAVLAAGAEGLIDYNRKLLEIARFNVDAAFEYAQDVLGARSVPEFVGILTRYARKPVCGNDRTGNGTPYQRPEAHRRYDATTRWCH